MPRSRSWDRWYEYYRDEMERCYCEYDNNYEHDGYPTEVLVRECGVCKDDSKIAEQRAAEKAADDAAAAAEEARLRATGWYDEITTIRAYFRRIDLLSTSELFEARRRVFGELFTMLLGYEKFLAAQPNFRQALKAKIAETRANKNSGPLQSVMDELNTLLERLPSVEGYKAAE